jgi:hypothetical protein
MSRLNDIVQVIISRETQAVTQTGFGIPAIISEFLTSKTITTFVRHRYYGSLTEMTDDGWSSSDPEYEAASLIFSQNPKVSQIMIGRKDASDSTWADALTAIQIASSDWYTFMIIASSVATYTFDIDFVTGNNIDFTINGTAVTTVPFNTDNTTTYADIKTQIEADIANSSVTVNATAKTVLVEILDGGVTSASVVVTGGASQAVGTVTYQDEDDFKAAAAWAETQTKIFFYASSSAAIYDSGSTTDIAYYMKNLAYDRTVSIYHDAAQGDASPSWIEAAWPGESLPYDPGSQTWAFKTLSGVAAYGLTSGERTAILDKNCNIYTETGGVNITENGKVASGEYIDIMRGIDWLTSRLQTEVFTNFVNSRKVPFTDEGITAIAGIVQGVLEEGASVGLLISESIEITAPKRADISSANLLARNLPDVEFTATLQGAIHNVEISGVVTV